MEELDREILLQKQYKKSFRHGRSAAAHFIDLTAFFVIIAVVVWLAVRVRFANTTIVLLLTTVCTVMLCFVYITINKLRFKRHAERLRRETERKLKKQKELLDYSNNFRKFNAPGVYVCGSVEALSADDISNAFNSGCDTVVSFAEPTPKAEKLISSLRIKVVSPSDISCSNIGDEITVSSREIDEAILRESKPDKSSGIKALINNIKNVSRERAMRYVFTGGALMLLSFMVSYKLYYRIMGSLCLTVGSAMIGFKTIPNNSKAQN